MIKRAMIKRAKKDNKGLSPIIATSLLILLVLVMAGIIFLWMRGFVTEKVTKFNKPAEQICQEISFDAQMISSYELEVANRGNVPISSFELKSVLANGDSEIKKLEISVEPGESIRTSIVQYGGEIATKYVLYPVILGNVKDKSLNKIYTCTDKQVSINL